MQLIFVDGYYKIARETGNQHNFLAIKFSDKPCDISITDLSNIENQKKLDKVSVFESVMKAVSEITKKDDSLFISEIQFFLAIQGHTLHIIF